MTTKDPCLSATDDAGQQEIGPNHIKTKVIRTYIIEDPLNEKRISPD